jgi:putative ABC transport system permease protein
MVVFSTEIRIKEIGVRKVFGADVNNLIGILGGGFISLILFSALIALPVVYLVFEKIVLRQVVYHSPVGAFELVSGSLLVIMISFIIISAQIYRIARTKPSDLLRNE